VTDPVLPFITANEFDTVVSFPDAVEALEHALLTGDAAASSPLRTTTPLEHGHLLYMPAAVGAGVGIKLLSVAPDNPAGGLPRIQGVYVLLDATTLAPVALVDGPSLTNRRTAALSALAVRHLAPAEVETLAVFGTGPQAWAHVQAIAQVRPLDKVVVVGRSMNRATALADRIEGLGLAIRVGTPDDVAEADVIACCTSAADPLFDSSLLRREATVVAMGSHSPLAREVDTGLVRRATVVVETRDAAMAEAGDILLAIADGVPIEIAVDGDLSELVSGKVRVSPGTPRLFKSVGQGWSDVVVAQLAARRLGLTGGTDD
jgi:ornithine cyclodeaminase/alanine dehydrogenase-like protein (mu-crystallin family)